MSLRSCSRCGATLTDVFRFCPACGDDANETHETIVDHGWPIREEGDDPSWLTDPRWDLGANAPKPSLSFPIVERPRRARPERRRPAITLRASAGKLWQRVPAVPRPPLRRIAGGTRRFLSACGDLARLLFELILVGAGSARDGVRSTVLLRKLHAQRAAVIYSSGCAALKGDESGVAHARAELVMLDELITAAATQTTLPFTPQRTR